MYIDFGLLCFILTSQKKERTKEKRRKYKTTKKKREKENCQPAIHFRTFVSFCLCEYKTG